MTTTEPDVDGVDAEAPTGEEHQDEPEAEPTPGPEPDPGRALAELAELDSAGLRGRRGMPTLPSGAEWQQIVGMANVAARSRLVPEKLRQKPDDVALILWKARDLGLPGSYALDKLHVIDGRVGMAAEVMGALILASGHELWPSDANDGEQATVHARRRDDPERRVRSVTWDLDMAMRAQLVKRKDDGRLEPCPNRSKAWGTQPHAMLYARALSQLGRWHFPDLLAGLYSTEELADGLDTVLDVEGEEVEASAYYAASDDPEARPISAMAVQSWQRRIAAVGMVDPLLVSWLRESCVAASLRLIDRNEPALRRDQVGDFAALVEEAEAVSRSLEEPFALSRVAWALWGLVVDPDSEARAEADAQGDADGPGDGDAADTAGEAGSASSGDESGEGGDADGGTLFAEDDPGRPFE